jgi:hypothetical protein
MTPRPTPGPPRRLHRGCPASCSETSRFGDRGVLQVEKPQAREACCMQGRCTQRRQVTWQLPPLQPVKQPRSRTCCCRLPAPRCQPPLWRPRQRGSPLQQQKCRWPTPQRGNGPSERARERGPQGGGRGAPPAPEAGQVGQPPAGAQGLAQALARPPPGLAERSQQAAFAR